MATYEPFVDGDPFTEDDWKEAVATWKPAGGDTFTNRGADATIVVNIPVAKAQSATNWVLGYSFADDASPWELHRVPGPGHPRWGPQMRPDAVAFDFAAPQGNPDEDNNAYTTSAFGGAGVDRHANYTHCVMTVKFGLRNYLLYEDDDPEWSGLESDRYVTAYDVQAQVEMISADNTAYIKFVETNASGPPNVTPGDANQSSFQGAVGERLTQTIYKLKWWEVPKFYICDADGIPAKLEAAVGKVNSDTFRGHAPGTLLMMPPEMELLQFPYYSEDGRAEYYNVGLSMLKFDPTPGATSPLARGHNLFAWRTGGGVAGGPGWFLATRDGTVAGPRYIEETAFADVFTHVES